MTDLREALDRTLDVYAAISEPEVADAEAEIRAAARRFLALTETGPDYEAAVDAWTRFEGDDPSEWTSGQRKRLREAVVVIVDAALADYLTEEETE